MGKLAFFFPGQGSQFVGMGQALADAYPSARQIFDEADAVLKINLSELCFHGPEDDLKKTANLQPALLTVSVAAHKILSDEGIHPDYVAGHSLGEYSALVAAGSLKFADALRLVRKRGQYMQAAVPLGVGAMAALLKVPDGKLANVLEEAAQGEIVTAANFNSPEQVVIAGHTQAVERAIELAKAAGVKRAVMLPVSAPFHCPLMRPAQQQLALDLETTPFNDLQIPLVNNWQAQLVTRSAQAREGLYEQIPNPVRWTDSVLKLADLGLTHFVEVGPGSVLSGLCRSIQPALNGARFAEPADLEKVKLALA